MAKKTAVKEKIMRMDKYCRSGMKCEGGGMIYVLGFIGALVYYITISTGFWNGVLGVLKALVWPAFLVFELLQFLAV